MLSLSASEFHTADMTPSTALKKVALVLVFCAVPCFTEKQDLQEATTTFEPTEVAPTTSEPTTLDQQSTTEDDVRLTTYPQLAEDRSDHVTDPPVSSYIYEVDQDSNLQDITAEESKMIENLYIRFEPKKYSPPKKATAVDQQTASVHITSYLADSETAQPMNNIKSIKRNKNEGADMISAFFVAPDDEVNEIDRKKYSGRPIVVSDIRDDLIRPERYTNDHKQLSNNILAPIRAAVSLSQDDNEVMSIEKQVLHEAPVYKTIIDIQKSIPYEIKEVEEQKEAVPVSNDLGHVYQRPKAPIPLYYRYPMYYLPQSYIGNYIMRHSHENTGYTRQARPVLPLQYYIARYQPQIYGGLLLGNPYYLPESENYEDQNGLQTEPRAQYQQQHDQHHFPPFRPSHPVFTSQYPPYTYRVLATMRARAGAHSRSARSKQLCIEYGGFKPPMVPSVQIDEAQLTDAAQEKSIVEENEETK